MANLYNKAGLINIPVGYSDGFLYNIKPTDNTLGFKFDRASAATRVNKEGLIEQVGYFGPELVTNGNFATDSDWSKGTNCTIENGKAKYTNSPSGQGFTQSNFLTIGKTYKITFTVSDFSLGSVKIRYPFNSSNTITSNGTYTEYGVATSDDLFFQNVGTTTLSIDNVSVVEVLGDKPRIDYTDSLTSPSFLLEPQSTNLVTYSEDLTGGSLRSAIATANTIETYDPSGKNNATKFEVTQSEDDSYVRTVYTAAVTDFSCFIYLKGKKGQKFQFFAARDNYAELNPGVIGVCTGEWQKVSFSGTFSTTSSTVIIGLEFGQSTDDSVKGQVYYAWGCQLEALSYPTSYIPTAGSTATRAQETCNGAGNASTFNSTEGVLYAEIAALANQANYRYIALTDGTTNNRVDILYRNDVANTITSRLIVGGAEAARFDIAIDNELNYNKFALSWKQNEVKFFINGTQQGSTDTNANVPPANTLNELMFNRGDGNEQFFGKTKGVYVFNKALTDDELQQLTGPDYNSFAALAAAYNYTVI